jgi:hypothetical protein
MNSDSSLSGSHRITYDRIFQHPVSHNLDWREVYALFRHVADVAEEANGNLKITRNGHVLVLPPKHTKEVREIDEVMQLRHFLQRSETSTGAVSNNVSLHWLLVIDRQEARIYRSELRGSVPEKIHPHEPGNDFRLPSRPRDSHEREHPAPKNYFEPIAQALRGDGPVLVFGSGKGKSSEMELFVAWAKTNHPDLAKRIIGARVVDQHHLTVEQLLAQARACYADMGQR